MSADDNPPNVDAEQPKSEGNTEINTGGGASLGNVNSGGGPVAGRDIHIHPAPEPAQPKRSREELETMLRSANRLHLMH